MMAGLSIVNNVSLQSNRAPSASFSCSPISTTSSPCCFSAGAALPFRESSRNQVFRIGDVIRGNRVGGAKVVCTRKRGAVIPMAMAKRMPLKIMISGAPACGKGTQSELIVKKVPDEILVERVVGRRLDPVTGKIYHLKYSPPETEEIAQRLTQRFDDTEEKVKLRLKTHHKNLEDVLSNYTNLIWKVDGNRPKEQVFADIDAAIAELERKQTEVKEKAAMGGN